MEWLEVVPTGIVRALFRMIPRLTALESLMWTQRFLVGAGWIRRDDRLSIIAEWECVAEIRPRAQSPEEMLEIVRGITLAMGGTVPSKPAKDS